ncbi:MAG: hypothetical protein KAX28_03065 [Candidatus Marinimicrobia bacterium]|nr:hypothetical protein [Candidatus Neomarinimicrobiota bacterium]
MNTDKILAQLISWKGQTYSQELGINLTRGNSNEIFKWFLASILFGTRISETIVKNTFLRFVEYDILTPREIVRLGWHRLVDVLDSGGYVRYDFKTADKLLEVMQNLMSVYHGDLNIMHQLAIEATELEQRIKDLGKGIGPTTAQIFLRELRSIWEKAKPPISPIAVLCAENLGIVLPDVGNSNAIQEILNKIWIQYGRDIKDFPVFESALIRVGKDYCRKNHCSQCLLNSLCKEVH